MSALDKLTAKHQAFVREYLIDGNGTQAAIRAGYSARSARTQAADLLARDDIKAAVEEGQKAKVERAQLSADDVMAEVAAVGMARMGDFLRHDEDGRLLGFKLSDLTPEQTAAIKKVKIRKFDLGAGEDAVPVIEATLELHDKVKPLVILANHFGIPLGKGGEKPNETDPAIAAQQRQDHLLEIAERYRTKSLPAPAKEPAAKKAKEKAA